MMKIKYCAHPNYSAKIIKHTEALNIENMRRKIIRAVVEIS